MAKSYGNAIFMYLCDPVSQEKYLSLVYFKNSSTNSNMHPFETSIIWQCCSKVSDLVQVLEQQLKIEQAKAELKFTGLRFKVKLNHNDTIAERDLAQ